jgi:ribonuclease P protein component
VTDRGQGLQRAQRLLKRSGFLAVEKRGHRVAGPTLVVYAMPRAQEASCEGTRLGITVSKKVGKAVVRNKVKRWLRESFRALGGLRSPNTDLVIIAKPGAADSSYLATKAEMQRLVKKSVELR